MCQAIIDLKNEAREEGHRAGKREGIQEGKQEGHKAGKREGIREGKREGKLENLLANIRALNKTLGLTYEDAMKFLRGESLVLSGDVSKGMVEVSFMGKILGQVKNIGTRANNLYPKPWRIKTTHIPTAYEPILKKI